MDFYLNVAHLQLHRRARALHRLATLCDEARAREAAAGPGSEEGAQRRQQQERRQALMRCLQDVCVPLLAAMIQEPGSGVS